MLYKFLRYAQTTRRLSRLGCRVCTKACQRPAPLMQPKLFEHETYSRYLRALIRQTVLRVVRDVTGNAHLIPISAISSGAREDGLSLPCFSLLFARDSSHGPGNSHLVP